MLDTHYHLDFLSPSAREEFAAVNKIPVVAQTLLPSTFSDAPLTALGFHPWHVTAENASRELATFKSMLPRTRFIGEIGLDFGPRNVANADLQREVFGRILDEVCAAPTPDDGPFVLSIHAVRAVTAVVDMLEERHVVDHNVVPVIHWFSGTSDELTSLIRTGGYVSINPMMLESKRGRAYAKQVPAERILLETDFPTSTDTHEKSGAQHAAELEAALNSVCSTLATLRGADILDTIAHTEKRLFGVN